MREKETKKVSISPSEKGWDDSFMKNSEIDSFDKLPWAGRQGPVFRLKIKESSNISCSDRCYVYSGSSQNTRSRQPLKAIGASVVGFFELLVASLRASSRAEFEEFCDAEKNNDNIGSLANPNESSWSLNSFVSASISGAAAARSLQTLIKSKTQRGTATGGPPLKVQASSGESGREVRELRALFDEIDEDHNGVLTEVELRDYAAKKGLPTTFVREFLDQARYKWRPVAMPWDDRDSMGFASSLSASIKQVPGRFSNGGSGVLRWPFRLQPFFAKDNSVDFKLFREFVAAKDGALKQSFERIDSDRDGFISIMDLEDGVKHVRMMCGRTGEFYPVKQNCVAKMMKKMQKGYKDKVSFQEFRDFFTLLPSSEYLLDYWLDASCCASGLDTGSNVQVLTRAPGNPRPSHSSSSSFSSRGGHQQRSSSPWNHLLAGALAGAISRTATAPLETLRLSMMVSKQGNLAEASQRILQQAGWRAFFKGNLTNVVRSAPQKAIDFFTFEAYKEILTGAVIKGNGSVPIVTAGALAGATSTFILYPLDVVKSRLTVQTAKQYSGILDALVNISRTEGVGALYRGLRPSMMSILPEAAITYGCFDVLKSAYKKHTNKTDIGVVPALLCGVTSAFTGQLLAYPLEVVARRSQVGGEIYKSMGHALRQIVEKEGIGGLYRGIVPASLRVIPMAIVSFGVYESTKQILIWHSDWEARRQLEWQALEEERRMRITTRSECSK